MTPKNLFRESADTLKASQCTLQAFVPKLLGRMYVTAYVTGNLGSDAATSLAKHVQALLSKQLKTQPLFASQVGSSPHCPWLRGDVAVPKAKAQSSLNMKMPVQESRQWKPGR